MCFFYDTIKKVKNQHGKDDVYISNNYTLLCSMDINGCFDDIHAIKKIGGAMTLTQEQKQERLKYITATDVPAILGLSKYKSAVDLWLYKTGQLVEPDIPEVLTEKGNFLEPAIREWFSHRTGIKVLKAEALFKHPTVDFFAAHTDGFTPSHNAVFEAKTAMSAKGWGEQGENLIPDQYLAQVAHEVACTDVERAHVAVLINGFDLRHYVYERSFKLESVIQEKLVKFWDCVKSLDAPTPITGDDVISLYGYETNEEPKVANAELQETLDDLICIKETIKDYQEKQKNMEDKIKVYMGQNDTLLGLDGNLSATWKKSKDSKIFNKDKFKDEKPELYKEYEKTKAGSRRFLVK